VSAAPRIALYARTYLDAEVEVPLPVLAEGKGKLDVAVRTVLGGFASNAARALARRFPKETIRVVTVTSWLDWPRLRAGLPGDVVLDAIVTDTADAAWPPVSVILNPASTCRLLRSPRARDDARWSIERVPAGALAAPLQALGRLPADFVAGVFDRAHAAGARVAWCGGDALPRDLEVACDLVCLNVAEAARLLGSSSTSPRELALALAARARSGAVRLVTGRGASPAVAALKAGRRVRGFEGAPPAPIEPSRVGRFKGAGDVFAAHFLASACFDGRGTPRARLDLDAALSAARSATAKFIRSRPEDEL
jgi:hypothetical protein